MGSIRPAARPRVSISFAKCGLPPPETATGAVVIDVDGIAVSFLDHASDGAILLHAGIGEAAASWRERLGRD